MFIEVLLFSLAGIAMGFVTGIVPGLHPNTLSIIAVSWFWTAGLDSCLPTLTMIASMAASNTVVNFIPSIFLGAPDTDNCLSVLPGHRFLLQGIGYEALFLTVTGGTGVMVLTLLAFPFLLWSIPIIYQIVHSYIHVLLVGVLTLLLFSERKEKRARALLVFLTSGLGGLMLLSALPSETVLFPALSGMFGLSVLAISAFQVAPFPKQKPGPARSIGSIRGCLTGWLAGMFVGILPGIGSSQAGVLASKALRGNDRDFMVALGGINTANIVFTLIAFYAIGRTRSGAAWAISEISGGLTANELLILVLAAAFSCFVSALVTMRLGRAALGLTKRVDYGKLNAAVVSGLFIMIIIMSGQTGIVISLICMAMGMACAGLGVKRMYLMGFLMLPTITHFSGISSSMLHILGL